MHLARCLTFLLLAPAASAAVAVKLDTTEPLVCSSAIVYECDLGLECIRISNESIEAPALFRLDFEKRTLSSLTIGDKTRHGNTWRDTRVIEGKIFLQGHADSVEDVRDAIGWTMSISQHTGKMTLTASGEEVAFAIFGTCTPASRMTTRQ